MPLPTIVTRLACTALAIGSALTGCRAETQPASGSTDARAATAPQAPQIGQAASDSTPAPPADPYLHGPASIDGIGKFYCGREIAQVMGHEGAAWLDRPERTGEERIDVLLDLLELRPTDAVGDIGAGSGTLTLPIARNVVDGRVYAVDIQAEMLALIRQRAEAASVTNVETVLGAIDDAKLPHGRLDVVLLVDAYHEFSHPKEMLASLAASLKPGGRLVQVEYRGEDPRVPIKPLHKMTEAQARREVEASGLRWVRTLPDLPRQHVLIFEKPRE